MSVGRRRKVEFQTIGAVSRSPCAEFRSHLVWYSPFIVFHWTVAHGSLQNRPRDLSKCGSNRRWMVCLIVQALNLGYCAEFWLLYVQLEGSVIGQLGRALFRGCGSRHRCEHPQPQKGSQTFTSRNRHRDVRSKRAREYAGSVSVRSPSWLDGSWDEKLETVHFDKLRKKCIAKLRGPWDRFENRSSNEELVF